VHVQRETIWRPFSGEKGRTPQKVEYLLGRFKE
jgi:hypothetical protein